MKKKKWLIAGGLIGIIIVVVVVFGYFRPFWKKQTAVTGQTVAETQNAAAGNHQNHGGGPQAASPAVKEEALELSADAPTVEIPEDKQRMIGVKTVEAKVIPMRRTIRTVGRFEYDERRLATINTKIEGWIEKLYVDYTGRYVGKGEPIAEIFSPDLYAAQQEFINILKLSRDKKGAGASDDLISRDTDALVSAARQRLKLWDVSDAQIQKIEASGHPFRTLAIYSPVSGFVTQKMAVAGMRVMPGEKLMDIADISSLWLMADIYEYELSSVRVGQQANIVLNSFPGKALSARIDYIYPTLSGDTRTAKVRLIVPNPAGLLKPQMFANVEITADMGKKLAIPDSAVIDTGKRQIVYVDKGDGNFEPREVMLGARTDGFREVTMGIAAGERVASSATFLIDSEAQLKGVQALGSHKH